MNGYKRVKSFLLGLLMIVACILMLYFPDMGYIIVIVALDITLLAMGIKKIIYYFTMARYMVDGLEILYKSIILLDLGMFVFSVSDIPQTIAMLYLIGYNAFKGVIDVLHSFDKKNIAKSTWKFDFAYGVVKVLLAVCGLFFLKSVEALIIIYCIGLLHSALMHIVTAFRKTAIVYIQ